VLVVFFCSSWSELLKASGYRGACAVRFMNCMSWYASSFWGQLSNNRAQNKKRTDLFLSNGIPENAETLAKIFMFLSLLY
jgi:hypothetical protein